MGCLRINNHRYEPNIHISSASVFNEKEILHFSYPSRSIFPFKSTCRFGFWGYRMKNLLYIVAEVYNKRENNGTKKEKKGWSSYLSFLGLSFLMHMLLLGL